MITTFFRLENVLLVESVSNLYISAVVYDAELDSGPSSGHEAISMIIAFCLHTIVFVYTYPNIVVNWVDPDPKRDSQRFF